MKQWKTGTIALILLICFTACRKDLCYDHDDHSPSVKVNVVANWELEWERTYDFSWKELWNEEWGHAYNDLRPQTSQGIRAIVYTETGSRLENNLVQEGGRLPMPEGTHDLLFYNNDTEYIVFNDLTHAMSATATTRGVTRSSLKELHAGEHTVNAPDQLYGSYHEAYTAKRTLTVVDHRITMRPLTYTYYIRYKFTHGLEYVALARGALAGMAKNVYLMDGHTGNEAATVLFDCSLTDWGTEALMQSFGAPNYSGDHYTRTEDSPARYTLNLEVRLKNGRLLSFEFDVSGQVNAQPRGGVIQVDGIEIPDGADSEGGFDVSVDDWGEWVDVPLPLE